MLLFDANGSEMRLGSSAHHGGEGTVYEHPHRPECLIKIYKEPSVLKAAKLQALVRIGQAAGEAFHRVTSWPTDLVYARRNSGQAVGFVMRKIDGVPIHALYSPKERKHRHPQLTWKNLVTVARNAAAAFHQLHATGAVLGDVNESNFLVDPKTGLVSLIDCDSYQIQHDGRQYLCPVGVGIWTSPELHGADFKQVPRTVNHDNFGLAVLLFQLLFIGRHPFASSHQGNLDEAIRQRLFSYAECVSSTGITPPPLTLQSDDVGRDVFRLFERAFLAGSERGAVVVKCAHCGQKNRMRRNEPAQKFYCGKCSAPFAGDWRDRRPTAEDWFNALGELESAAVACSTNPLHSHLAERPCPFCRLDRDGYSAFAFSGFAHKGELAMEDVVRLMGEIEALKIPVFEGTQTIPLNTPVPSSPRVGRMNPLYVASWISAAMAGVLFSVQSFWIGITFAVAALGLMATGRELPAHRKLRRENEKELMRAQGCVTEAERNLRELLAQRREHLARIRQKAMQAYKNLLEIPAKLESGKRELEEQKRQAQLKAHFDKFAFPRYFFDSFKPGIEDKLRAMGIQTPQDVLTQTRPPGIPVDLWTRLLEWSKEKEGEFVFDYLAPIPPTALLALNNRLQRERTEEQVALSETYQAARALVIETQQTYETRRSEILNLVRVAREAEARIEALG